MLRPTTSASNIHRRALCPGSERLEAGLPDDDSEQSREGSLLHGYAANPKLNRFALKPAQRDLLSISDKLNDVIFDHVREQFGVSLTEEFEEGFEKELYALPASPEQTPGHCDRYCYWPDRKLLVIIDDKYGYKVVTPAASNYQLRVYAIGGHEEWEVEDCVVAIKQPRLAFEERLTLAAYTREDILAAIDELRSIRQASAKPDAPLISGAEQCRYCKAKLVCPQFRATVTLGLAIAPVNPAGTVAQRTADAEGSLSTCNDDALDAVLIAIQFSDFIKDLARDEARRRIANGALANWKLGKETEVRKIVDPKRALSLLTLKGDLTRDEVFDCSNPSITKIEEKIRVKTGKTWKEAREILETTLAPVIEREPKKPSLTRIK